MYKRLGRGIIIAVILITGLAGYLITKTSFNYDFESFFPVGDPDLEFYKDFLEHFESDNDYLLIAIENTPSVFDSAFLFQVDRFSEELGGLELVNRVTSPTDLKYPVITPIGPFQLPYFHPEDPSRFAEDSIRIWKDSLLLGNLVAENGKSLAILVDHKGFISKMEADTLMQEVTRALSSYSFEEVHLAGKANAQQAYIEKTKEELIVFVSASIILVVILLILAYRSWWGVIIPLIVVMLSVVWTVGFMAGIGKSIDILMVLLPTILFVVGMSDVVHIITKYLEELRSGVNKIKALKTTVREIGLATFLTSLTTSIGFFTLITARIIPIRQFGIFTGIGVFLAYLAAFSLLPACLLFLRKPSIAQRSRNKLLWVSGLRRMFTWVIRHKRLIIALTLILSSISVWGITQIRVNTFLIEGLPKDDPLKADFLFFDQYYGGSRPFELAIELKDSSRSFFDYPIITRIDSVERYVKTSYGAGNIYSPATVIKLLNQASHGGNPDFFSIPDSSSYPRIKRILKQSRGIADFERIISSDGKWARITGKAPDIGSHLALQKNEELENYLEKVTASIPIEARITGTSLLLDKNNLYLSRNMIYGLSIAFVVIALIAAFMYRSLRMILIVLIPNLIPLILIAGIMGIFQIPLQLSTSIIFTIAFGIAVDDSIHFMAKLRLELNKKSLLYALKRTYFTTGKAIIVTTLILSGGFLTLLLSNFTGTFYTGLLVSITLLLAVVADLTLLPALLILFYRWKK